jgi:hypothetical protein
MIRRFERIGAPDDRDSSIRLSADPLNCRSDDLWIDHRRIERSRCHSIHSPRDVVLGGVRWRADALKGRSASVSLNLC